MPDLQSRRRVTGAGCLANRSWLDDVTGRPLCRPGMYGIKNPQWGTGRSEVKAARQDGVARPTPREGRVPYAVAGGAGLVNVVKIPCTGTGQRGGVPLHALGIGLSRQSIAGGNGPAWSRNSVQDPRRADPSPANPGGSAKGAAQAPSPPRIRIPSRQPETPGRTDTKMGYVRSTARLPGRFRAPAQHRDTGELAPAHSGGRTSRRTGLDQAPADRFGDRVGTVDRP